jgi:transposase-like protein
LPCEINERRILPELQEFEEEVCSMKCPDCNSENVRKFPITCSLLTYPAEGNAHYKCSNCELLFEAKKEEEMFCEKNICNRKLKLVSRSIYDGKLHRLYVCEQGHVTEIIEDQKE